MIEGIDIFQPRENGLPDFSKISPGQIFNGSVAASINSMKDIDPYGLLRERDSFSGIQESPYITTTIDPISGKRVEVRKAKVVEEILGGSGAAARGQRRINSGRRPSGGGGSSYLPGPVEEPDLPTPDTPSDPSLLSVPPPTEEVTPWHPPMAPDYRPSPVNYQPPPVPEGNVGLPMLFPPELTPQERRSAALRRLPVILLDELKDLHLV